MEKYQELLRIFESERDEDTIDLEVFIEFKDAWPKIREGLERNNDQIPEEIKEKVNERIKEKFEGIPKRIGLCYFIWMRVSNTANFVFWLGGSN